MPENKSLGQIAYEGYFTTQNPNYEKCGIVTPYSEISHGERENWDDAAQVVRRAVIEECIQAIKGCMPFMIENDANGDGYREALAAAEQALRSIANEGKDNG